MGGGNLSLQVHPTTDYIQKNFNMHYTQDESYYILDCEDDGCVYLGAKTDTVPEEFIGALENAQETGEIDVERFVNKWEAKKHDHSLIPAGTLHCSGSNTMVLEISATPYIFTFKLWDWGRLGLDGKPRPINIKHGSRVIQYNRNTEWVCDNLIGQVKLLEQTDTYCAEKTGLHAFEPIETVRHWFTGDTLHKANGSAVGCSTLNGIVENPFVKTLEKRYSCSVHIENDARCALLCESEYGALKNTENAVLFVLGSSLGCAVKLNGKLLSGATGQAGAMFFMPEKYSENEYVFDTAANSIKLTRLYDPNLVRGNMRLLSEKKAAGDTRAAALLE